MTPTGPRRAWRKLVRARDRRCRFPGCTVAAVFCDLDHVRPWPAGPTTDTNLICLCRRHHRVKQRPGWHVILATDGIATWTDPTGRVRTTDPADALHRHRPDRCTRQPDRRPCATPAATRRPRPDRPHDGDRHRQPATHRCPTAHHSDLEFRLEHHAAADRDPPCPAGLAATSEPTPPLASTSSPRARAVLIDCQRPPTTATGFDRTGTPRTTTTRLRSDPRERSRALALGGHRE